MVHGNKFKVFKTSAIFCTLTKKKPEKINSESKARLTLKD
jgi:hypothetical protein